MKSKFPPFQGTRILGQVDAMGSAPPLISVLIPVYNEVATIGRVLQSLDALSLPLDVIVIDDGSQDGSADTVAQFTGRHPLLLLRHPFNLGKGAAIRTGLAAAQGQLVVIQDADLEYKCADLERVCHFLIQQGDGAVYGVRQRSVSLWKSTFSRFPHAVAVAVLNGAVLVLYGKRLHDVATCYKAFYRQYLNAMQLSSQRFEICEEFTAKAIRMGLEIREIPIAYVPRSVADGKKIRARDFWQAIAALWKYRQWHLPKTEVDTVGQLDPGGLSG